MVNKEKVISILKAIKDIMEENKIYLNELDGSIGDGDHGLNMSRGFNAVYEKVSNTDKEDMGEILKDIAMTLISNTGGASGALYGTAFLKSSAIVKGKSKINISDFLDMIFVSIEGIKARGNSKVGEKTILDAIVPAYDAGVKALHNKYNSKKVLEEIKNTAFKGAESTKMISATKGKASYLGEKGIGYPDPGATSSALILEAIYNTL